RSGRPPRAPPAASARAELLAELADARVLRADDLAREGALAHARHVRLRDTEPLVDAVGAAPEAPRRAGGDRTRRRDEGVRPVIEVEQRPLRSFEQHALAVA